MPTELSQLNRIRVLHVDDDPNQFEFLRYFIHQLDPDLEVVCVQTPQEVFRELEKEDVDCIVTDFQMPQMNGIELAKKIKQRYGNIPIIIYTGQGSEEVAEAAFAVGIDDYIRKELDTSHYQVLVKRIKQVVEKNRTEMLYQRVVQGIRDGLALVVDGKIIYANQAQAELFGYERVEDIIGTRALDYVYEEDLPTAEKRMAEVVAGKANPHFYNYRVKRRDGELVEVEVTATVIPFRSGLAFMVLSRDLSERKRLEEEKRVSEERFRKIVELAPDGIVTVSLRGIVTSVNPAFLKITGFSEEEIIGKPFYQLGSLRNLDIRNNLKMFAQIVRGKLPPPVEFVFQYKDGSMGWGEAHLGFIERDGKKELLAIVRDITERKWVESELYKTLEKNAQSSPLRRSETPTNTNLCSNPSNIEKAVKLQTSLLIIKNNLLKLRREPSKLEELLDKLEEAVELANIHLKDLFEPQEAPASETVDAYELVGSVLRGSPLAGNASFEYVGERTISTDPEAFKGALENLVNYISTSTGGGGRAKVRCVRSEESMVVEVVEEGRRLSEGELGRFFSGAGVDDGNLASLAVKQLEDVGGNLLVENGEGEEVIYTMVLPLMDPSRYEYSPGVEAEIFGSQPTMN